MALQTPGRWVLAFMQIVDRHLQIRAGIHKDVADPFVMLDHGDLRFPDDCPDQIFARLAG